MLIAEAKWQFSAAASVCCSSQHIWVPVCVIVWLICTDGVQLCWYTVMPAVLIAACTNKSLTWPIHQFRTEWLPSSDVRPCNNSRGAVSGLTHPCTQYTRCKSCAASASWFVGPVQDTLTHRQCLRMFLLYLRNNLLKLFNAGLVLTHIFLPK